MRYESLLRKGPGDSNQSKTQAWFSTTQTAQSAVLGLQQQAARQNIRYDTQYPNFFAVIFYERVTFKIDLFLLRGNT